MPQVGLGLFLLQARNRLRDLSVRIWAEPSLIYSANEGKNELARILRHTREDYFVKTITGTISTATAGNPSELTLPTDFAEYKDMEVTTPGYFNIAFSPLDRTDPNFRALVVTPVPVSDGITVYFDIIARGTMQIAPGLSLALGYKLYYVHVVPDMVLHTDIPDPIPPEYHDFIVNWIVTDALRSANDPRFAAFNDKLKMQSELMLNAAQQRRVAADPKFARAFDEE
jgi:hypothetical protein